MRAGNLLQGLLLVAAVVMGSRSAPAEQASDYAWFDPIIDVHRILLDDAVIPPDEHAMQEAILRAMVASLDDPHTQYIPFERSEDFTKEIHGNYVGIGARLRLRDGRWTIETPMEGSPALEAGLRAGDEILAVDGHTMEALEAGSLPDLLSGEPGSPVSVTVRHMDGAVEPVTITRARIVTPTVEGLVRRDGAWSHCLDAGLDLAYVAVTQFTTSTPDTLRRVLAGLALERPLGGVVLDLRGNRGGALPAAVATVDLFLEEGEIVSVHSRRGGRAQPPQRWQATAPGTLPRCPMIVLVNEQSASASEIVSGALQDHGRARILGTRTFGKGSVQEIRQLEGNRGILKFTTGHYVLPSGRRIDRAMVDVTGAWGVAPSPGLRVHETDAAMAQRLRARREHRRITEDASAPACPDPAWIRTTMHDELLAVAAEVLTDRVRRGAWPQRFDEDDPASVAHRNEIDRLEALRGRLAEQLIEMEDRLDVLHAESHGGA